MTTSLRVLEQIYSEISGTFDIAVARNDLRKFAAKHNLSTMVQARSAAALTIIAELVLFKTHTHKKVLKLTISCIEDGDEHGLQFEFEAPLNSDISQNWVTAEWQLERACDEIGIKNHGEYDTILMRLWMRKRRVRS